MVVAGDIRDAFLLLVAVTVIAALLSAGLIVVLRPLLRRYALAHPNARSSHRDPTPQGGGIAVVAATIATAWLATILFAFISAQNLHQLIALTAAVALLALVGMVDDLRGLAVAPRLALQCVIVGALAAAVPADLHIVPALPLWMERVALTVVGVWFVNLVNFMDGIDWMTVTEVVPITAALALFGALGAVSPLGMLVALALLGGILGFAPFNRPVATLFLGDVGSLPIGLLLGWLLLDLAAHGHAAAAMLLPLYYLADATLTLLRRLVRGERVWEAHRSHFYQQATDRRVTVRQIVARVLLLNVALAALALLTVFHKGALVTGLALATGCLLVAWLLWRFAQGKP
jgi:UDP-N-acetylmuramyl pentapeptide phosphotransferase/UDP-N-acetylglucosamine-1-phosphate transferase